MTVILQTICLQQFSAAAALRNFLFCLVQVEGKKFNIKARGGDTATERTGKAERFLRTECENFFFSFFLCFWLWDSAHDTAGLCVHNFILIARLLLLLFYAKDFYFAARARWCATGEREDEKSTEKRLRENRKNLKDIFLGFLEEQN